MMDHNIFNLSSPRNVVDSFYQHISPYISKTSHDVIKLCQNLIKKRNVHSYNVMKASGFTYINAADTVRCDSCGVEISEWTRDMIPFSLHSQLSPTCPFVVSMLSTHQIATSMTITNSPSISTLNNDNGPSYLQNSSQSNQTYYQNTLFEVKKLKQIRKRSFSNWPHRTSPSSLQMIKAGFFNCNIGDRVICIYCNIICQHWISNSDDPCKVHKTLSPKCPYVIAMLTSSQTSSTSDVQSNSLQTISDLNRTALNKRYIEAKKRHASFSTWPDDNLSFVDDLVKAGFFYTGNKSTVTCFYCNGSLHNVNLHVNPMIEHARQFPHCAYVRSQCDMKLFRNFQHSKSHEKTDKTDDLTNSSETNVNNEIDAHLSAPDESIISQLAAGRIDLPISSSLLKRNFKLAIIKRCWEDQLRLNRENVMTDCDLLISCIILQKQIDHINGSQNNIIIPFIAMKKLHDQERSGSLLAIQTQDIPPTNPCVFCLTEEKCLACLPCGHLIACIKCSYLIRLCPICHQEIGSFVRVFS